MSYLEIALFLLFVLSPLLIPVSVTAVHAVANWRLHDERFRAMMRRRIRALKVPVRARRAVPVAAE
jgi:hypothetical protein